MTKARWQLSGPLPLILSAAIAIEVRLGNRLDATALRAAHIATVGAAVHGRAQRAGAAPQLRTLLRPVATVKRDGKWQNVDAATVVPGDLTLLAVGGSVPADCRLNGGAIELDTAALTSDPVPTRRSAGDLCPAGCTVTRGGEQATVVRTGRGALLGRLVLLY